MTHAQLKEAYHAEITRRNQMLAAATGDDLTIWTMEECATLMDSREGYLRLGVDYRTGGPWARWKWTKGEFAGRYVFGTGGTIIEALASVLARANEAKEGKRLPALDRPAPSTKY